MKPIVCSWCQMYRPGQDARMLGCSPAGGHGICQECKLRWLAEGAPEEHLKSPCCGYIGSLLPGGQRFGLDWRRCPCGHLYCVRAQARKE